MKKTLTAAALFTVMAMGISGCAESILTSKTDTTADIWTAQPDDVVAWAGGELSEEEKAYYDIAFKDFYSEYSLYVDLNGLDETNSSDEGTLKNLRQGMMESLARERVVMKKAEELGLDVLTDEEAAEVNEDYEDYIGQFYTMFEEDAQNELGDTSDIAEDELKAKQQELVADYLAKFDLTEENVLKWVTNNYIYSKVVDYIGKDVTVTDKEVEDYITSFTEEAKSAYEKSVSDYEGQTEYQAVWVPEGSRRVKYILIAIDNADAAELAAERNESDADNSALDARRDELLKDIQGQADAALEKLKNGDDFDAVLKEYGANYYEGAEDQTTLLIYKSERTIPEVYEAAYKLEKPGDISGLIPADNGYFILKYVSDAEITEENMEDVRKATYDGMVSDKKQQLQQETLTKWLEEIDYQYDYENLNYDEPEEETSSTQSTEATESTESTESE